MSANEEIENIRKSLMVLKDTNDILHSLVQQHQTSFDTIEDEIVKSKMNTLYARKQLVEADDSSYGWIHAGIIGTATTMLMLVLFL